MTAIERVCDILAHELGLANGQVYLWDQKINLPTDSRLYIAVGVQSCKPFSNTKTMDGSGPGLNEIQSTNFQASLSIDLLSRGTEARDRKEEVILALASVYSQQQQEAYGFYVAPITSGFVNLSAIEETAILYRFNLTLNIQYKVTKTIPVPYFGTFTDSVIVNP